MEDILKRLDKWLQNNRPDFYSNLNPGLKKNQLIYYEKILGFTIPENLKCLYSWKNGQSEEREEFFDFHFFAPIEEMIERWKFGNEDLIEFNEDEYVHWGPSWLCIFTRMDENFYCVDVKGDLDNNPGAIIDFQSGGDSKECFPNLEALFSMLLEQFESGVYRYVEKKGKKVFKIIDEDKEQKIFDQFTS